MTNEHDKFYYRQRNRNRIWEAVIKALDRAHDLHGIKRKDIADFLGVPASQVSRWLSGPSNWEVDTVSDLLLAAGAEMDYEAARFEERVSQNEYHTLNEPLISVKQGKNPVAEADPSVSLEMALVNSSHHKPVVSATVGANAA
jgi:transcriptional regulator with XRE-family HTH domain